MTLPATDLATALLLDEEEGFVMVPLARMREVIVRKYCTKEVDASWG